MQSNNTQTIRPQKEPDDKDRFVRIPRPVYRFMRTLQAPEAWMLTVLLDYAKWKDGDGMKAGECRVTVETLSEASGYSRPRVFGILKSLRERGAIQIYGSHGRHASIYKIVLQPSQSQDGSPTVSNLIPSQSQDSNRLKAETQPSQSRDSDSFREQTSLTDNREQTVSSASTAKPQKQPERLENETTPTEKPEAKTEGLHLSGSLPGLDLSGSDSPKAETKPAVNRKTVSPDGPLDLKPELRAIEPEIRTWLRYKSEKGQSYKTTGFVSFQTMLLAIGSLDEIKAALSHSMASNYAGVFAPKNGNGQTHNANQSKHPDFVKFPNWNPADPVPAGMDGKEMRWHLKQLA